MIASAQMPPPFVSKYVIISVSNAPIYHNPYVMQWDGYTNYWMELQSCTNLAEGKWQTRQVFFFPTSTIADFTNPPEFWKLEVKHRFYTNQITTNNP